MIIDPDRPAPTLEQRAYRKFLNEKRRAAKAAKPKKKGATKKLVGTPGLGLAPLWKRQRIARLKARGNIRTPHTRALWRRYWRGELNTNVSCI